MVNSNPKPEKMSKAAASEAESQSGSIEAVATRLLRWGRIAPSGLARIEYISDTSQMAALQRLRDGFQKADIPFVEIVLPVRTSAAEQVRFLRARLAQIESGVVSITGFARAFSEDTPILESLRILNYNRENLADFPLCQIWWMPRDFAQTFRQSIPDLNSWFIIKLRLDEIIAPLNLVPRLEEIPTPHTMSHGEAVKASNFYATRFRTALQRQSRVETLWRLWIDAIRPLIDVGRTNEAIHLQDALLQEASENGIEIREYLTVEHSRPGLLNEVGVIYYKEERLAQAEPLYTRALAIYRATLPPGHLSIGNSLNNLALLYESQGRYNEAEPLFQETLAIVRDVMPEGHLYIANTLNNLAALYQNLGRYTEAEPLLQEAVTILRKGLPTSHPAIANSLNNLALLYKNQGRNADAEPLYTEALKIYQSALPQGHPNIAASLNNLAEFCRIQGRIVEAESLFRDALAMRRNVLPSDHLEIANSLNSLAALYENQGRYAEAEPLLKEALAILHRTLPAEHRYIGVSLGNLASLYERQARYAEAEPLYKEALAIHQRALPAGHPDIADNLNSLACLYSSQGRNAEADMLFQEALSIFLNTLGLDHQRTQFAFRKFIGFLREQGNEDDIVDLLQKYGVTIEEQRTE